MKTKIKITGVSNEVTKAEDRPGREVYLDGGDFGQVGEVIEVPEFRVIHDPQSEYAELDARYYR